MGYEEYDVKVEKHTRSDPLRIGDTEEHMSDLEDRDNENHSKH